MRRQVSFLSALCVTGVIGLLWISSAILILFDRELPILKMVTINMVASFFIGSMGFRVEKK